MVMILECFRKRLLGIVCLTSLVVMVGCGRGNAVRTTASSGEAGVRVSIRLANRSDVAMENVRVRFPSQTEVYGTISPHTATTFRQISKAYRYAKVEATVNGQEAVLQPQDYVGEKLLNAGQYTYALTFNPAAQNKWDRLRLEMKRE